ncbi:MAG: hypothetical protein M0R02_07835 [Bacteroidales bacterium]|nr:hypothetical protein [Bacteroidales bacterium]NLK80709.1 hypothetical protein [Bacteroidales bacterium]
MRLYITIVLICFSFIVIAQENKHLKGKTIDITFSIYESHSSNINIYIDGLKLNDDQKKEIGNKCVNCVIDLQGDSIAHIKSRFLYLINGELFKTQQIQEKLPSLNPSDIISFEVYSKNEASENFDIKAKYGLIKIEVK